MTLPLVAYERKLDADWKLAMSESGMFFEGKGSVPESLQRITHELTRLKIDYAVVGGLALFRHGFRRYTEDVGLLVTSEGLQKIHEALEGRGYVPPFSGSKNLRDTQTGVKIEFLVTGQFPGDGKPKAVSFPDPSKVAVEIEGVAYVNLPTFINLKLASGMTGSGRLKDLSDCQELIKAICLPRDFADKLDASVRDKYFELWNDVPRSGNGGNVIHP